MPSGSKPLPEPMLSQDLCHDMASHWVKERAPVNQIYGWLISKWVAVTWFKNRVTGYRAANQYGTSVFCTDFTCKIREYEFGLQNTEIELCQFCHLKYCCQNKAYLFWVAIQSSFVAFYALKPSNTSLITKTFNILSSTCGSSLCSCQLPDPVVPKESTRVSTGSGWVPPE